MLLLHARKVARGSILLVACSIAGCAGSGAPAGHGAHRLPSQTAETRAQAGSTCAQGGMPIAGDRAYGVVPHCPRSNGSPAKTGTVAIRHRAGLCFTDSALRVDAGEALGSIEPGQRFRGRSRIVHRYASVPISNVKTQLRVARRLSDGQTKPAVTRIATLAREGIRRLRRHPYLIVHGGIGAFRRADRVARRAHVEAC